MAYRRGSGAKTQVAHAASVRRVERSVCLPTFVPWPFGSARAEKWNLPETPVRLLLCRSQLYRLEVRKMAIKRTDRVATMSHTLETEISLESLQSGIEIVSETPALDVSSPAQAYLARRRCSLRLGGRYVQSGF